MMLACPLRLSAFAAPEINTNTAAAKSLLTITHSPFPPAQRAPQAAIQESRSLRGFRSADTSAARPIWQAESSGPSTKPTSAYLARLVLAFFQAHRTVHNAARTARGCAS